MRTQIQGRVISTLLLTDVKRRSLRFATRAGVGTSGLAIILATCSSEDRERRILAATIVLIAWVLALRAGERWRSWMIDRSSPVLIGAVMCVAPFALDGNAQSNVMLATLPLAGVASTVCRRRQVALFVALWVAAYVVGIGLASSPSVLTGHRYLFDVLQGVTALVAVPIGFAVAILTLRRLAERIPEEVARQRSVTAQRSSRTTLQSHAMHAAAASGARPTDQDPADHGSLRAVLSRREYEVARLVALGKRNRDIAKELFIAESTVESHVKRLRGKLGAENRQVAAAMLTAAGILDEAAAKN